MTAHRIANLAGAASSSRTICAMWLNLGHHGPILPRSGHPRAVGGRGKVVRTGLRRAGRALLDYLPKGHSLPPDAWRVRHRTLSYLLRTHALVILVFGLFRGHGALHSGVEASVMGGLAVLGWASSGRRQFSSAVTAVGLVASSAVLVHLSGGTIEMHFHFFVMVGILTLYQDWLPFLVAIGFVVVHHGVLGTLAPGDVYNHPAAIAHPFKWALVHGVFVLAASTASVVAWKLNEEQGLRDALTRLPNRRLFHDRVGHAVAHVQRRGGSLAVLFLDLDGFKDVNDSLGHASGDHLLTLVAERITALVRPSDTAARLGGDEFAVLLEDLADETSARFVAERLIEAVAAPFVLRGLDVSVGASVGIALHSSGASVDDLLVRADTAMYAAKASGRGRCRVFHHDLGDLPRRLRDRVPVAALGVAEAQSG